MAPVVLFVYNRPHHTLKTIEALKKNKLSDKTDLIIFSDGPNDVTNSEEILAISKVRDIIKGIEGFRSKEIHLRDKNLGLANSIITGVGYTLELYQKVIVLEDDIVTSPYFLQYMNDSLTLYANNDAVMHVSGYMFPVKKRLPDTFFLNTASCWGWGTWKRAWEKLNLDSGDLIKKIYKNALHSKINLNGAYNHFQQLIENHEGKINTWAIFWHSSIIINAGFCLHPYPSLTNNIGNDDSGTNSRLSDMFKWGRLGGHKDVEEIALKESKKALRYLNNFYKLFNRKNYRTRLGDLAYKYLNDQAIEKIKNNFLKKQSILNALDKYPRYYPGETKLYSKQFRFVDSKSTAFTYKEIFQNNVYAFNSKNSSPLIIDCGANVGLSVLYFKRFYPSSKIIAFEPDSEIYNMLKFNIWSSGQYKDVQLINAALWSHNKGISFQKEGADAGKVIANRSEVDVKTQRLSEYLLDSVDYLKIDIEGAEWVVIQECGERLKNVKQIFIEYHSFKNRSNNLHLILELLSDLNFRYYLSTPGLNSKNPLVRPNLYAGMDMQVNIFAKNQS